jgi:hypothetical protein
MRAGVARIGRCRMRAVIAMLVGALLCGMWSTATSEAAAPSMVLDAKLTPNALGASTNLSATLGFLGQAMPGPVSYLRIFGPAGMRLDVGGLPTCAAQKLEADGPRGCPAESRVGFGGGIGIQQLGAESFEEPFKLDFFLAPPEHGHLAILILVSAIQPIALQLVLRAREARGPSPYGFGLEAQVPPISTVPGATNVVVTSGYVSLGASDIAYYRVHDGVRRLVRVNGLLAPRGCPEGGFQYEAALTFEDGSTSIGRTSSPCPRRRR